MPRFAGKRGSTAKWTVPETRSYAPAEPKFLPSRTGLRSETITDRTAASTGCQASNRTSNPVRITQFMRTMLIEDRCLIIKKLVHFRVKFSHTTIRRRHFNVVSGLDHPGTRRRIHRQ